MAPKGKAIDRSSPWSEYVWDDRGYWYASRYGPTGDVEYDYRSPETTTQTAEQEQATPRTPGENVLSGAASSAWTTSSKAAIDQNSPIEAQNLYTTSSPAVTEAGGYGSSPSWQQNFSSTNDTDYTTAESTTGTQNWNSSTYSTPQIAGGRSSLMTPNVGTFDSSESGITQSFQSLSLGPLSNIPEQAANFDTSADQFAEAKKIRRAPNSDYFEELDPRYRAVEDSRQKKFWKVGRVFMMLWTEPARNVAKPLGGTRNGSHFSVTYLKGIAYSEIRRFVVIAEGYGSTICSPIHTYSGQATLKPNLPEPQQHAIIYTSKHPPDENWYKAEDGTIVKEDLNKDPIRVVREQTDAEGDLGTLSRINYSKIYTVENYVRVLNIGKVHDNSMQSLIDNSLVQRRDPPEKPRSHPSRSDPKKDQKPKKGESSKHTKSKDKDKDRDRDRDSRGSERKH